MLGERVQKCMPRRCSRDGGGANKEGDVEGRRRKQERERLREREREKEKMRKEKHDFSKKKKTRASNESAGKM